MVAPDASYARIVTLVRRSVATVREQDVSRSGLKAEKHGGAGAGAVGCVMTVSSALALCAQAGVRAVLWYPVKSLARPNTLLARLGDQKAQATTVEGHVTPLAVTRNALNGSGMVFVNAPAGVTHALAAQAAALGEALATHDGRFGVRVQRTA